MWLLASWLPVISFDLPVQTLVGGLIALVGGFIDLAGVITFMRARTSVNPLRPDKTSAIVTAGIYGITRNPMYVGLVFVLSGWFVYLGALSAIVGPIGFVLYIHRFQILPEERVLTAKFGNEYRTYMARVRRWL